MAEALQLWSQLMVYNSPEQDTASCGVWEDAFAKVCSWAAVTAAVTMGGGDAAGPLRVMTVHDCRALYLKVLCHCNRH